MSFDPKLASAALEAAVNLGADLEDDLKLPKKSPTALLLAFTWREARDALLSLIDVDAADAAEIRRLQNDVVRFLDMRKFVSGILEDAREAAEQMDLANDEESLAAIAHLLRPQTATGPHDV
jgi:hypothetical protein